jgi:hypothetical protein
MKPRHRRLALALALLGLAVAMTAPAEPLRRIVSFGLQSMESNTRYGPFALRNGSAVALGEKSYRMETDEISREFALIRLDPRERFGPYELEEGRIVLVDEDPFVVVDIRWGPVDEDDAVPPQVGVHPEAEAVEPAASPPRPDAVPPRREPAIPPAAGRGFFGEAAFGLGAAIVHEVDYELDITDIPESGEITIDRTTVSLSFEKSGIYARAGFVADAEWQVDTIAVSTEEDRDIAINGGTGVELTIGARIPIWRGGNWSVEGWGELFHRSEEYDISYETTRPETFVGTDTNGNPVISTRLVTEQVDESFSLNETVLFAGGGIAYTPGPWRLYARIAAQVVGETDSNASVDVETTSLNLKLDRAETVMANAGVAFEGKRFGCVGEMNFMAESVVRLGVTYRF